MALPPGSIPPPTARPTLPNPRSISAKPKPKAGKNTPARRRILAASAGGPNPGGVGVAPANPYQSQAQAEIDPIIAAITAAATGQAGTADKAIQGLTDSYAKGISGIDYGAPYSSGEAQQAAVDSALQQSATGQGSDLAAALSQRLQALQGSSGGAAVQQAAAALSSQGAGAGQAQLASGSAALNQLISDAAAAKGYGQKMPGVIDSAGLQGIEGVQNQAQQAISQGTLQAESQLPQIEQSLQADHLQAQSNKQTQAYRNQEIAARQAALGISSARARASIAQGNARLQQGAQRIGLDKLRLAISQNQGQQRINIEAQRAAQSSLNQNRNYSLSLSRLGIEKQRAQVAWLSEQAKLSNGGYTSSEAHKLQLTANLIATNASKHHGPNGMGLPGLQQVMQTMQVNDIPPSIALKAAKLAGYQPGKAGMFTWLSKQFAGGTPLGGKHGGKANYGVSQGIGAQVGQAAGGAYAKSDNAGGFLPKGMGFSYDRHDQGRDIQARPGAPILAPGDGYVVRIASDPGGGGGHFGPSYPIVHFTSGPYAGKDVYIGHTVTAVKAGQRFKSGSVLSRTQKSGPMNGGAPSGWAEIGFAPGGSPGAFDQPAPF